MATLIFSFLILLLVIAGMAVGVILGRAPIKGSCGGLGAVGVNGDCGICGGNPAKCEVEVQKQNEKNSDTSLAYDADNKKRFKDAF